MKMYMKQSHCSSVLDYAIMTVVKKNSVKEELVWAWEVRECFMEDTDIEIVLKKKIKKE